MDYSQNTSLKPWFQVAIPHHDIREGRLDESVFAANLAEVADDSGPEVYRNAAMFFRKTFFTTGFKNIAKRVIGGLNGIEDVENRVISLQTGFGGGKTHTLISLYHLCKMGRRTETVEDTRYLTEIVGKPDFDKANIAVFTNATNDPANGRLTTEGLHIQTIWGEIAYQLGGKVSYEIIAKNDAELIAPAGRMKQVLEKCQPALILVDELADYCVKASARKAGGSTLADQTISFMQELTEAVSQVSNCVLVVTLPASPQEVGNTPEAQAILNSLQKRVSRVGADTQPVADDEIYEVIRRRLFETVGDAEVIAQVAAHYSAYYQRLSKEVPSHVTKSEYRKQMEQAYPFHPELIDVFRIRWASHSDFQRTRGALRLLASIVSDLWKRSPSLTGEQLLIHASQVEFSNLDALSAQLKKLHGNGYDAVITADVSGISSNAYKIDADKSDYGQVQLTQGIAAVVLMNSFGIEGANKGLSVQEIKLNVLRPGGVNHNSVNGALDQLEEKAHFLYYSTLGGAGKRYWFFTKPNLNILVNQAKVDVSEQEVDSEIVKRLKDGTRNVSIFRVLVDPSTDEVAEQKALTLVVLRPKYSVNGHLVEGETLRTIERVATKKGNSERIYRNTILYLVAAERALDTLHAQLRELLACDKINREYQHQIDAEQKAELKKRLDEISRKVDQSLIAAYSVIVKYRAQGGAETLAVKQFRDGMDRQITEVLLPALKDEEWVLEGVGLNTLRKHNLLPTPERNVRARDVYEAFLRFDDKPMVRGERAVQEAVYRFCVQGEFVIAFGDGTQFSKYHLGYEFATFAILDENYWLLDKSKMPPKEPDAMVPVSDPKDSDSNPHTGSGPIETPPIPEEVVRQFQRLVIQGKVPVDQYSELFRAFIAPFAPAGNRIEIEVKFTIHSSTGSPLDESRQQYKNAKEAARQLGLGFGGE